MKWVQHQSNSHNNLKFQALLSEFGMSGYGKWWVCVELVAEQGQDYRIKAEKNWKNYLKKTFGDSDEQLEKFLEICGSSNLIDRVALKKGDLYIPKMSEYCDDYSKKKVRTISGQTTDNIPLEEKRREYKRREESNSFLKEYQNGDRLFKPTYKNQEMRWFRGKWWVLPKDGGEWLEFGGPIEDIDWK